MAWDGGWTSPDEQAEIKRAAEEAQQRAGMTEFEKQALGLVGALVDSVGQLVDTVGSRQPADPICDNCGALQRVAGEWPVITFDARRDRAAEQLFAKHGQSLGQSYPFWAGVVRDVLDAMNWLPAAGDGGGEGAGPVTPHPARRASDSTTH